MLGIINLLGMLLLIEYAPWVILVVVLLLILANLRTVRPSERGVIERFGKYNRFANPGLVILIPFIERLIQVNITEQLVEVDKQEIITKDALNATVDAQIYFKVREDEQSVKNSQYKVFNYEVQVVQLARTTLRSIIGDMTLADANTQRSALNVELAQQLQKETNDWGIEIVRAELKQLQPPPDVQESMNNVIKAKQNKDAAVDNATATETEADGMRRAAIKQADGERQAEILRAEGKAQAIKLVNDMAAKTFVGNAVLYKKLETAQIVLKDNTKIIVPEGSDLVNVIGDSMGGIIPIKVKKDDEDDSK